MEELRKSRAWQVWTCLKSFYTADTGTMVIGAAALFITIAFITGGPWFVGLFGATLYIIYNVRNYILARNYFNVVIKGWLRPRYDNTCYTIPEMIEMIEHPSDYIYEITRGFEIGKSIR